MISIITPVLNEKGYVEPFLIHLNTINGDIELILVDGGSTDGTINEILGCTNNFRHRLELLETKTGRGHQMNRGAEKARGNILLFLHVDSLINRDSLRIIERTLKDTAIIGGGFTQRFNDPDTFLTMMSLLGNFRTRLTNIFYGDYGFFIKKEIFEQMGGYDDIPYLEDVEICRRAKKFGKLKQIDCKIYTSARRYTSKGRIRLSIVFILAVLMNSLGLRPAFLGNYIADK
ncbi:MAG: TIGR04283 family arsenosugar biosynthesis glycosyltransferase [ANME-2 cluster archaeon]|nr:TIGR04283 family arsenosugar biosynthesis glycosyltransferase [ANME-2 cluster archaeon]